MRPGIPTLLRTAAALWAVAVHASVSVFPEGGWKGISVARTPEGVQLVRDGKTLLSGHAEPLGRDLSDVSFAVEDDALVVDARTAFSNGLVKIVFVTPDIGARRLANRTLTLVYTAGQSRRGLMTGFFEGYGTPSAPCHFHRSVRGHLTRGMKDFGLVSSIPDNLRTLRIRLDVNDSGATPVRIAGFKWGPREELPPTPPCKKVRAELTFHATFDGSADAAFAVGRAQPLAANGLAYVPGKFGQAVRLSSGMGSLLEYATAGNIDPERGTFAMWTKREWPDKGFVRGQKGGASGKYRFLAAHPRAKGPRAGSGQLCFWWWGSRLRGDVSDEDDSYVTYAGSEPDDGWHHVAMTWDECGVKLFFDGRQVVEEEDGVSPMTRALNGKERLGFDRDAFDSFFVGNRSGEGVIDGLIDDFRIYSAPLDPAAVKALWDAAPEPNVRAVPDYAALFPPAANPYEGLPASVPGTFAADDLVLVETIALGTPEHVDTLKKAKRLNAVGPLSVGTCEDIPYLEAAAQEGSRFAVRLDLDASVPFYVLDVDYPDDKVRTMDLVVQAAHPCNDYTLQVGVAAGGEYPNTGQTLTHRCIWWTASPCAALVAMTARQDAPAALSAIRVYRPRSGTLPVAAVRTPKPVGGWNRTLALYFEDPAIGLDFSVDSEGYEARDLSVLIDRTAALMKFTGENMLGYPGCFYHGLIGGPDGYNPRHHAPGYLSAWYVKFDREGLSLMPTMNPNTMPVPDGLVTRGSMEDGSLHSTSLSIHDTGKPNWGGWHGTPPNFCIAHPDVQNWLESVFDTLLDQGAPHPSFKGICLHITRHCMLTFGGIESGYNDYCIEAFEKAKGVKVEVDRSDPLRGKAYAAWIAANARDKWLDWRSDVVTGFWSRMAKKLAVRRPDLKLWFNVFSSSRIADPRFLRDDYLATVNREMGIDPDKIARAIPNAIVAQGIVPADGRWRTRREFKTPEVMRRQIGLHAAQSTYELLARSAFPWCSQHDRYWESAIGALGRDKANTLTCDWMTECVWRVSTINPSGRHALRHFVLPMRYHDILGMSKGGFLIGTYGMEPHLAEFARAYRALPAVRMEEFVREGNVVGRQCIYDDRRYLYVVNTEGVPAQVDVVLPADATDLATGERVGAATSGASVQLRLKPYELRSFQAPVAKGH